MNYWPLEYDDAIGWGHLGLVEAVRGFDEERGWRFSTYAQYRIRGEILDAMRRADPLPRPVREYLNGQPAPERGMLRRRLDRGPITYAFYGTLQITSMDATHQRNEECLELADPHPNEPDEGDEYNWPLLLATLDARERAIVILTTEGKRGLAIARRLGLSEARVGQLKRRAYGKLRKLVEQQRDAA